MAAAESQSKPPPVTEEAKCALAEEITKMERILAEKRKQLEDMAESEKGGKKKAKDKKKDTKALIDVDPVQGCRDFPPEEMRLRNYLFSNFREVAKLFAFQEYDAPVLEAENLYTRKAGEEIVEQMYNFTTKGGHRVALRPEMTPTLARLVMQKGNSLLLPIKWYSIPQCWRYEAIVRGRRREHYQWNMDIFGVSGVTAEAELLMAVITLFKKLGLTAADVGIKINSRKLLQTVLSQAGVPNEKFAEVCIIVDKIDKRERCEIVQMLKEKELEDGVIETILNSLCLKTVEEMKGVVGEDSEVVKELTELFTLLDAYGCSDWVQFDAGVVRGLAYYTGVVFEAFSREGTLRAICGGGRYDNLMATYGAKPIPAVGFGFGDCVIIELLRDKKLIPDLKPEVEDLIIPFNETMRPGALTVLRKLRDAGRKADIILEKKRSPKQAFSYADRIGVSRVIFVAPDEWGRGCVRVKDFTRDHAESATEKDRGEEVEIEKLV